jgi:hypothetical protein
METYRNDHLSSGDSKTLFNSALPGAPDFWGTGFDPETGRNLTHEAFCAANPSSNQVPVEQELAAIDNGLTEARAFKLEAEVLLWAMKDLQANPTHTIAEAMEAGLAEWIK